MSSEVALAGAAIVTLVLAVGGMLVAIGRILQRLDNVEENEKKHVDCAACRPEVIMRLKTGEARTKELEMDRKEQSETLVKLTTEWTGLRETMEELRTTLREMIPYMKK